MSLYGSFRIFKKDYHSVASKCDFAKKNNFIQLYPNTGYGVMLNKNSHSIPAHTKLLYANSIVSAIITDGNGGFYIGGAFTKIENTTRNHLAHINADGSLHSWNPDADGPIYCLTLSGNTIFTGGDFTNIG